MVLYWGDEELRGEGRKQCFCLVGPQERLGQQGRSQITRHLLICLRISVGGRA